MDGGYYAYVTNQHSNVLSIVDPDPNGDGDAHDAAVVGTLLLANGSSGAGVTDGTGGQGVKPLPITHDGWIQQRVALSGTGRLSAEVEGWLAQLTREQKNPLKGDVTNDGCVDNSDLEAMLSAFGRVGNNLPEDINHNGIVDSVDLATVLLHFGEGNC